MMLIADKLPKTREMMERRGENPEIPIKCLPELNSKVWGLHTKKMTIIAARTSQGKSSLASQIAYDIAKQGIPTLYISLEMYDEDIVERMFCMSHGIDNFELLTGKFKNYLGKWDSFCREVSEMPLVITDMIGRTWQEVDKYISGLTKKPKVIFIDHLQEAKSAMLSSQKEVVDEYLKSMREVAIRNDLSMVILSQINRASQNEEGNEPQLHHLKNSGYIEECADCVWLLHWPWHYKKSGDKNAYTINVAKNRNGRTGWIKVRYVPENYLFVEQGGVADRDRTEGWTE